jgi:hypothetical protein
MTPDEAMQNNETSVDQALQPGPSEPEYGFDEHIQAQTDVMQSLLGSADDKARTLDAAAGFGSPGARWNPFEQGSIARRDYFDLGETNKTLDSFFGGTPEHRAGTDTMGRQLETPQQALGAAAEKDVLNNPLLSGKTIDGITYPTLNKQPRTDNRFTNFPTAPGVLKMPRVLPGQTDLRKQVTAVKFPGVPRIQ